MSVTCEGRRFTRKAFNQAYRDVILGNRFQEIPAYYRQHRSRYRKTLEYLSELPLPRPARVLEIGGGQIAVLCRRLFEDHCVVGDVSEACGPSVTQHGIKFVKCDLLHDDLPNRDDFDVVVLCEVVEHLPIPLYIILEKVRLWVKPGGFVFITTPNLYRLRNVIRLALGMKVFGTFFYPEPGQGIGHPFEYYKEHLIWHLEKAGLQVCGVCYAQLIGAGSTMWTNAARWLARPLLLRPLWRDCLVAWAQRLS